MSLSEEKDLVKLAALVCLLRGDSPADAMANAEVLAELMLDYFSELDAD